MNHILILYLGSRGGGVYDTYAICEALSKVGKNQYSLMISENNPLKEDLKKLSLKDVYIIKTHKLSLKDFLFRSILPIRLVRILRLLNHIKPSLIFITMFHPWMVPLVLYTKLFMPKTVIAFIRHNPLNFESIGSGMFNKILNFLENLLTNNSDYIITLSESVREEIISKVHIPSYRIFSIKLGAHKSVCKDWSHSGFLKDGVLRLLFFGRILNYKGIDTLIEAFEDLKKEGFPVKLTIAGEGTIDGYWMKKIEELDIRLMNYWVSEEELCKLLAETDIVVLPYKEASQSGPASISLALGIPVIATKVGGLKEQVRDGTNGILVEPNSPKALAEAVRKILKEPALLKKFSEGAKKLSDSEFSWEEICKRIDEKFTEILSKNGRGL